MALSGEAPASYTLDAADDEEGMLVVTDQRVVENGTARTGDGLPIGAAAGLLSAAALVLFAYLANRRKEEA